MVKVETVEALLTLRELSKLVGLKPRSLEEWRRLGKGPGYVRLSGEPNIRYPASEVKKWLAETERSS
jgi:predicted DNA-binding transcriptional regulator AlpA